MDDETISSAPPLSLVHEDSRKKLPFPDIGLRSLRHETSPVTRLRRPCSRPQWLTPLFSPRRMTHSEFLRYAPGAPGLEPRWTSSSKEAVGTAYHTSSRVWFTLSHGILNEVYWPTIDRPNIRDFGLVITDGATFVHEEKRDLHHDIEYPEKDCLLLRQTNTDPQGRYRIVKEVLADPYRSVVLVRGRLEILDESLRGKLRVFALLAPHLERAGMGNNGFACEFAGRKILRAYRGQTHLTFGAEPDFLRRSVGYVGVSDGWQDLMTHRDMRWEYTAADDGNIALTAEIDLSHQGEWTCALSFGPTISHSATNLLQSLAVPFAEHRKKFCAQWRRTALPPEPTLAEHTGDGGSMARLSRALLLAHEDKLFTGAIIASLSIPWGEDRSDGELGGYHLVWTRDLVQSASALLAVGQTATPRHALIWLHCIQLPDGSFPQNSWMDGAPYWRGVQLDETAAPALLAWRLRRAGALGDYDPLPGLCRAARFLLLQGPVTQQDRWEEASGYSASTLAVVIASFICTAELLEEEGQAETAEFLRTYADWLNTHVEDWLLTRSAPQHPEHHPYYVRVTPAEAERPDPHPDPDALTLQVANGGGAHPANMIVGGDFLHLVRFGLRPADHPPVRASLEVIDRLLKHDLPQGPAWRRYNHDGYGQKDDGTGFDGTGVGRCWPILTGERGHYELAAGRDPLPYIKTLEGMANTGGMLSEQLWDGDDLPAPPSMKSGAPTGAAMPLCWSHAEYLNLVRSRHDGVAFDLIPACYERYVKHPRPASVEIWTPNHRTTRLSAGRTVRLLVPQDGAITLFRPDPAHEDEPVPPSIRETLHPQHMPLLELWFVDLPTATWRAGTVFHFEFASAEAEEGYEKAEVQIVAENS